MTYRVTFRSPIVGEGTATLTWVAGSLEEVIDKLKFRVEHSGSLREWWAEEIREGPRLVARRLWNGRWQVVGEERLKLTGEEE